MRRRATVVAGLLLVTVGVAPMAGAADPTLTGSPKPAFCSTGVVHGPAGALLAGKSKARGCRYDTGVIGGPPSIAVTRKGVAFVTKNAGEVLRSTDGGLHWKAILPPANKQGDTHLSPSSNGYVHVDPVTDRVWYVTSGAASCTPGGLSLPSGSLTGSVVSWSDDLGKTWGGLTLGCDTYLWGRIVTGYHPKGKRHRAAYFLGEAPRPASGQRPVLRSLDDGRTWQRTAHIASATTEAGAGVTAPDGTIYFDYPEFPFDAASMVATPDVPYKPTNLCRQMVAVSEDFGDTWRQEPLPGSRACNHIAGAEKVAVDRAGTVYATWTDDVDGQLRVVHSRDKGRSWSAPLVVRPAGTTFNNGFGNLVAGAPGHLVISGMYTKAATNPRVGPAAGVGEWYAYLTESFDAAAASPRFESVALDAEDDPSEKTGGMTTEVEAVVAMTPAGQSWTVYARHGGPFLGNSSRLEVGRLLR